MNFVSENHNNVKKPLLCHGHKIDMTNDGTYCCVLGELRSSPCVIVLATRWGLIVCLSLAIDNIALSEFTFRFQRNVNYGLLHNMYLYIYTRIFRLKMNDIGLSVLTVTLQTRYPTTVACWVCTTGTSIGRVPAEPSPGPNNFFFFFIFLATTGSSSAPAVTAICRRARQIVTHRVAHYSLEMSTVNQARMTLGQQITRDDSKTLDVRGFSRHGTFHRSGACFTCARVRIETIIRLPLRGVNFENTTIRTTSTTTFRRFKRSKIAL